MEPIVNYIKAIGYTFMLMCTYIAFLVVNNDDKMYYYEAIEYFTEQINTLIN